MINKWKICIQKTKWNCKLLEYKNYWSMFYKNTFSSPKFHSIQCYLLCFFFSMVCEFEALCEWKLFLHHFFSSVCTLPLLPASSRHCVGYLITQHAVRHCVQWFHATQTKQQQNAFMWDPMASKRKDKTTAI